MSFTCQHEKLSGMVWTATAQNRKQVVHTYRASYRSGWPRGFGELNPSPHSWIFTSVSVDSSPRSQSLLPLRSEFPITLHESVVQNLSRVMWCSTFKTGTARCSYAPLQKSCRNHRFYVSIEALAIRYGFHAGAKPFRYNVKIPKKQADKTCPI